MRGRTAVLSIVIAMLAVGVSTARSATLEDFGWHATLPTGVTISNVSQYSANAIKLDIEKIITGSPDEYGQFPAVHIGFAKDSNGVPDLIIDRETVTNATNYTWTDFEIMVYPYSVEVDPSYTGLTGSPFTYVEYITSPVSGLVAEGVYFTDGQVLKGGVFSPGGSSDPADLLMIHTQSNTPADFVVKEIAYTPEPMTLMLLASGLAFAARRRRA